MNGIGSNINKFAAKLTDPKIQKDGTIVQAELAGLGQCGQGVIGSLAQPMSEVVGLLTEKSMEKLETVELPKDAPKDLTKELTKELHDIAPKVVVDGQTG